MAGDPECLKFHFFFPAVDVRVRYAIAPAPGAPRGTIFLLPGRTEFIEKYKRVIGRLLQRRFAVVCPDWRGQGLSTRPLANRQKHHIRDFTHMIDDLQALFHEAPVRDLPGPNLVLAHSMGGHVALRYAMERDHDLSAMVLSAPMAGIRYPGLPGGLIRALARGFCALGLGGAYALGQGDYGPLRRSAQMRKILTHSKENFTREHDLIDANPGLALGGVTWRWLVAAEKSIRALHAPGRAEGLSLPVLMFQAGEERLVNNDAMAALARRLPHAELVKLPRARHEILQESEDVQKEFWDRFDRFLEIAGL